MNTKDGMKRMEFGVLRNVGMIIMDHGILNVSSVAQHRLGL